MSLEQREVCIPPASGWSRMGIEIYKVKPRRMPRYSRMSYHQKGPRTQIILKVTGVGHPGYSFGGLIYLIRYLMPRISCTIVRATMQGHTPGEWPPTVLGPGETSTG